MGEGPAITGLRKVLDKTLEVARIFTNPNDAKRVY
jgi:hypothetical protein